MGMQVKPACHHRDPFTVPTLPATPTFSPLFSPLNSSLFSKNQFKGNKKLVLERFSCFFNPIKERSLSRRSSWPRRRDAGVVVASSNVAAPPWESWKPEKSSSSPSLSDILWPSAGAFAAMALFGKIDQILGPKGISMTIAPIGAVCAVLFASPSSPAARKYNMFVAQIGCAAIGVLALSLFGPGWLARSAAIAASIAFMIYARASHPPAASLPILFIDGAKFHHLNFWFALFPGAAACILLCLIQEIVCFLKDNLKF